MFTDRKNAGITQLRSILMLCCLLFAVVSCASIWTTEDSPEAEKRKTLKAGNAGSLTSKKHPPAPTLPGLPLAPRPEVIEYVKFFMTKRRPFMEQSLERSKCCIRTIRAILREHGLPSELSGLALVESGFKPYAKSKHGARGIWQFMKGTARAYGLRVNMFTDERTHLVKSTEAASRYLTFLYGEFSDWHLALAAYNAGPGTVRRAIKAAGTRDFYRLAERRFFRRETREFVPKVLAAAIISEHPEDYGFESAG